MAERRSSAIRPSDRPLTVLRGRGLLASMRTTLVLSASLTLFALAGGCNRGEPATATAPASPSPAAATPAAPSPSAATPGSPSPSAAAPGSPSPSAATPGSPNPSAATPAAPSPSAAALPSAATAASLAAAPAAGGPAAGTPTRFGAPLSAAPALTAQAVLADPKQYDDKDIKLTGQVSGVCQNKGCWMTIGTGEPGAPAIRVRFKDYAFFVPRDSMGKTAVVEGRFKLTTLSVAEAQHYADDAAKAGAAPKKITAPQATLAMMATGVELL